MQSGVLWPCLIWNSHHLVVSRFAYGFMGFLGHLTVLPIPFMTATNSTGSILRLYLGTWAWLARIEECSLGLVDGKSSGQHLSHVGVLLGVVEQGSEERVLFYL